MVDQIRFFAGAARMLEGRSAGEYMEGLTSIVRREPVGVCAQVAPWNYPMMMAVWKFAPALAAGNTVVLKPSDTTPASTVLIAEIIGLRSCPRASSTSSAATATPAALMVEHPTPAMASITGSVRAGMQVAESASKDVKRVHLELGGKAPVVVFEDTDIAKAVEDISVAGFFNAGQDCTAATRVLVHESIHDEFVAALAKAAADTKTGQPDDEDVLYGPLNNAEPAQAGQPASSSGSPRTPRSRRAATGSATRATSTPRPSSPASSRTTRSSRTRSSARSSPSSPSRDEDQAVEYANGVEYALASSVWTKDHARAMRMSKNLDFGCVWINTHIPLVAEMPHGGFKKSGYGKDLSAYGFEDYTRIKHVMTSHRGLTGRAAEVREPRAPRPGDPSGARRILSAPTGGPCVGCAAGAALGRMVHCPRGRADARIAAAGASDAARIPHVPPFPAARPRARGGRSPPSPAAGCPPPTSSRATGPAADRSATRPSG